MPNRQHKVEVVGINVVTRLVPVSKEEAIVRKERLLGLLLRGASRATQKEVSKVGRGKNTSRNEKARKRSIEGFC